MEVIPKIDLFPRVTKVANALKGLIRHLPESGYPSSRQIDTERALGHQVLAGEISAVEAYERLGE